MKKIILAVAIAALASMSVVAFASAGVVRNQVPATIVVSLTDAQQGNHHTFNVTSASCDGSFVGTGQGSPEAGGATENIVGTYDGTTLKFTATYTSFLPGYTWSYNGPLTGSALGDNATGYHATAQVTMTTYANHGAYVSANGGGDDAAHSCIGMPIGA